MSKTFFSTNVIIETLTLNLDTYDTGPKNIDSRTLAQFEKLMDKIQQFLNECTLVPFEGDKKRWDKLLAYCYQQPNVVRCRICSKCLNDYEAIMEHIKLHEKEQEEKESKPTNVNFMTKLCIPRLNDKLCKTAKKFLSKDCTTIVERYITESDFVRIDIDNDRVQQNLATCLEKHYPLVKLYPFGSRIAGTGLLTSDLDLFVDLQNMYFGRKDYTTPDEVPDAIEKIETILSNSKEWTIEAAILNARVPLLRVVNSNFDLHCDLTFSNGLAHRNSLLLQYMFSLQPTSRMLVCYLKNWNREGCLNAYTLSLMVIFMYQCYKLLPPVAKLQEDSSSELIIDGLNAGFATPTLQELNMKPLQSSIPDLVYKFFEFYSFTGNYFSIERQVVCPFLGERRIMKSIFQSSNYDEVPPQMERLKRYMLEHQDDTNPRNKFAYNKPFVVQDPFELCHNVAKAIPVEKAARVMRSFELSMKSVGAKKKPNDNNET